MFERGYRQHLEADLVKLVADGVISGDVAQAIRLTTCQNNAVFVTLWSSTAQQKNAIKRKDRLWRNTIGLLSSP